MLASDIHVPASGPVVLPHGRVLDYDNLSVTKSRSPKWHDLPTSEKNERVVRAAARDGLVLCLRPGGLAHPARFGLTLAEALAHVSVNGLRDMIAVHPYDEEGEPIVTADGESLTKWAALPSLECS